MIVMNVCQTLQFIIILALTRQQLLICRQVFTQYLKNIDLYLVESDLNRSLV